MNNKPSLLQQINVFKHLSPTQLSNIEAHFKYKKIAAKQHILRLGEPSNDVYFLCSGTVRATSLTNTGSEVSYQDLGAGDMFGELAAIDGKQRSTDVVTLETSELLWLTQTEFKAIIYSHPEFAWAVLNRITELNRLLCSRVFEFSVLNVQKRIRSEIVRLYEQRGYVEEDTAIVDNPPKHQELANRLATHREAVTRELNDLAKKKIIAKQKNRITIYDLDRLKHMIWS